MAIYSKVSGIGASSIKGIDGISITNIRAINASLSSAFALLLDERYGFGAEAAYSVRRLSGVYNGPLLVVRRDSDDATLEVSFTSSNDLDVSAIETFCGTANGYVTEWRDQSGNLNHAAQTAETSQPKIYDATTGIELNAGRPALNFAADFFDLTRTISTDPLALFSMHTDGGNRYFPLFQDANNYVFFHTTYGQLRSKLSGQFSIDYYSSKNEMGLRSFIQYTDGSEARTYVDGVDVTHVGGYQITTQQGSFTYLGYGGTPYSGLAQEVIVYSANKSGDRTDIEENIAGYYGDNVELLDTYSGAAAAYSLRKLSSSYNGALVRVREDGGDTQADIYANVFGELDTIALADHCGSNNGLVVGWYDQSGNLNNATQPAFTIQPKIYDATTGVVKENGQVSLSFNFDKLELTGISWTSTRSIFTVLSPVLFDSFDPVFGTRDASGNFAALVGTTANYKMQQYPSGGFNNVDTGIAITTDQQLIYTLFNGSNSSIAKDGSSTTSVSLQNAGAENHSIGSRGTDTGDGEFKIQEHIVYLSDQSSNRTGIEKNINTFYGIYDTGLIGEYSGAAAAYSLRSLSSVYDGAAITVRRDSDDSTKNIYFDSDGNLDTAALIGFCGNNNGYAIRWFDQSGNANHGIQTAEAAQPKVYDSVTGIYYENGTPSLRFERVSNSVGDTLFTPAQQWIGAGDSASSVIVTNKYQTPYGDSSLFSSNGATTNRNFQWFSRSSPSKIAFVAHGSTNATSPDFSFNDLNIRAAYMSSATVEGYQSGVDLGSGTAGSGLYNPSIEIYMGARWGANEAHYFGMFKEFIFWDSYLGADKVDIDQKINQHYLIYQPDTAPTSGLLASYPGVTSAYSLRQLSNEAVIAITVRRDSDDNVSPIGFDGRELDTEALAAWCGNSNGYVTTWWDQSLNQVNGTQGSLTLQPKIYDASTGVVTKNGKPAIEFDGVNDRITLNFPGTSNTAHFVIVGAPTVREFRNYVRDYAGNNFRLRLTTPAGGGFSVDHRTPGGTVSAGLTLPDFSQFVQTALITPTTVATHLNGVGNSASFTNTVSLRNNGEIPRDGNAYASMLLQEFMVYPSDQTSNRTGIENNIFSFYTGYLLDQYSGAAAAYSLRALSSTATNAVKVRRDSDDATQYIGFVRDGFILSLDTSALSTFCGSANGYVSEWVDQSGNGNHATQPALTSQPKIYDSSTGVITPGSNSKPAIDGSDNHYLRTAAITTEFANGYTYYAVVDDIGYNRYPFVYGEDNTSTSFSMHCITIRSGKHRNNTVITSPFQRGDRDGLIQSVFYDGATNVDVYMNHQNGTQNSGSNTVTALASTTGGNILTLLSGWSSGSPLQPVSGQVQELIIWPSDQSANRTNIEDNINGYYDIY